jgi:hypothetical protein
MSENPTPSHIKLAIVGSRNYTNYPQFSTFIQSTLSLWSITPSNLIEIVSGGAQGADLMAEKWAREHKIPIKIFKPDWNKWGKSAGPLRNQQIIEYATHVIAFPSKDGRGTQDSIARAKRLNRPLCEFTID